MQYNLKISGCRIGDISQGCQVPKNNLAINSFKNGQKIKCEERPNFQRKFSKINQINFEIS
jgi:hypothetical protein